MADSLFVRGGTLVDTGAERVIDDAGVVTTGERIVAVGPVEDLDVPADADEIDASGRTILPGFVDAHAHLSYTETTLRDRLRFIDPRNSVEYNTIGGTVNAGLNLERGVTSLRDVGSRGGLAVAVRDAVEDGLIPGPRVKASGPMLTTTGGLADWAPEWIDADAGFITRVDSADEATRAAREQIKLGVDTIKVEASGEWISTFASSRTPTMRQAEIEAVVAVAHDHDVTVAAHAKAAEAIVNAARAGVDTVEHGTYLDDEGIEALTEHDVTLVTTVRGFIDIADGAAESGHPPEKVQTVRDELDTHKRAQRRAHDAGVTVAAGTDSGPPYSSQGNLNQEIVALVEHCGFSPLEAIVAGTRTAAEAIGLDDAGTLEAGSYADLIVVDGDPVDDVGVLADWGNLSVVVKGGEVIEDGRR